MPLESYEDFLDLSVKQLQDYLSVRDMNISGKKIDLVRRAFAAFELGIKIVKTAESQIGQRLQ